METTLFLRTWRGDRNWLRHSLPSLRRHAHGFKEIVVAMPHEDAIHFSEEDLKGARLVLVENDPVRGYLAQQITKLHADEHTTAPFIMFSDSDTLAREDFQPRQFFYGNKPIMLWRRWEDVAEAAMFREPVSNVLGFDPELEHMPCLPLIYHRSTLDLCRQTIRHNLGMNIRDYLIANPETNFSEFNALGAVAWKFQQEHYEFRQANPETDGYPRPLRQFWSHSGVEHCREELEALAR